MTKKIFNSIIVITLGVNRPLKCNSNYIHVYFSTGAASIGKGIGGILFSRFSRSSGQVGGVEEEPSDSEGGACEKGEEGRSVELDDKPEEKIEEKIEEKAGDTSMSPSASVIMDNSSCKWLRNCALLI